MKSNVPRLMLIFLGVFAVLSVGVVVWQVGWVMPMKKCEAAHKWWDHAERVCATPVLVSDITGRVITDEKALAEARKAIGRTAPATPPAK
jgi:hypothetical protein